MVEGLVMIHCQNHVRVLSWLMGASCLCVKQLAIEMDVGVLNRRGAMEINFLVEGEYGPPSEGVLCLVIQDSLL